MVPLKKEWRPGVVDNHSGARWTFGGDVDERLVRHSDALSRRCCFPTRIAGASFCQQQRMIFVSRRAVCR